MIFCDLGLNVGVKVNLYIFLHYLLSGIILLVTEMELINLSWKIYFSQFLFMFNLLVLNSSGIFLKKNNSTILVMNKNSLDNIWIIYLHMLKPRYNSIPCIQHVLSVCYWIKEIGNQNLLWFSPLYEKMNIKNWFFIIVTKLLLKSRLSLIQWQLFVKQCFVPALSQTEVVMKLSIVILAPNNILVFKQEKYNIRVSFLNILFLFKSFPFLLFLPSFPFLSVK